METIQDHFSAGYFYVIQPIPAYPYHLKVGIADHVERRLKQYKTLCPQSRLLKSWHLFDVANVEQDALSYLMCKEYHRIGREVFFARKPDDFVADLDAFFNSACSEYYKWDRRGAVLTVAQAAEYMGKTYADVSRLIEAGKLRSERLSPEDHHLVTVEAVKIYQHNVGEDYENMMVRSKPAVRLKQPE